MVSGAVTDVAAGWDSSTLRARLGFFLTGDNERADVPSAVDVAIGIGTKESSAVVGADAAIVPFFRFLFFLLLCLRNDAE
jgi:hypothetical protein